VNAILVPWAVLVGEELPLLVAPRHKDLLLLDDGADSVGVECSVSPILTKYGI